MESILSLWGTFASQCTFPSLPSLTWQYSVVYVNLFLQIESDFYKFFIFIWFQKYEPAFFLLLWETLCFITQLLTLLIMDMLGSGSLSIEVRVLCIMNRKYWTEIITTEANAFSIFKCDVTFFFVQKSTVFLNSLLPSKSKSV